MKRVGVVGAGISGLAAALKLCELKERHKADLEVLVLEKKSRPGGNLETESRDGFLLEKAADAFVSEKPSVIELSRRLGLDADIIETRKENRRTFVVRNKKLIPLPEGFYLIAPTQVLSFLGTPLFSLRGKMRVFLEPWISKKVEAGDESIGSFIRRRFGAEVLDRVGQAMLGGIYSGDPEILSLSATMPRFLELERKYGSVIRGLTREFSFKNKELEPVRGPRYSLFCSFRKGMQSLPEKIAENIPERSFRLKTGVQKVARQSLGTGWRILTDTGETLAADAVLLSASAKFSAAFLRGEPENSRLVSLLDAIGYESVATVNLAYRRDAIKHPLDGFGFVVPRTERLSLTACSFSSRKFEGRSPEGFEVLRAFVGGAFGREFFERDDESLSRVVKHDMAGLLGITEEPVFSTISRYRESMVQYRLNHGELVSDIEKELLTKPGLWLIGSSYRGPGISDCVRDAETQAEKLFHSLFREVNL
ncbi:MAG: protoporphyrinogen oxidase [Candidatus Omnitrophica bacterium]|nr:protoporphyrinogen oxidase [Candidatus Omnitrophota bacterium]